MNTIPWESMNSPTNPTRTVISLYGPSGVGKSTIGRALAQALNLPFMDLDQAIESRLGMTIPQIFAEHGEATFRAWEHEILRQALDEGPCVLALGGGALLEPASRTLVEQAGPVVCLSAALETLVARLRADREQRPLLGGDTMVRLERLLHLRAEHYASFPLQLDTDDLPPARAAYEVQVLVGAFHVRGMGASYDVRVGSGLLDQLGPFLEICELNAPIGLVSDAHVAPLYAGRASASVAEQGLEVHPLVIAAGETHKTITTVTRLWDGLLQAGLERGSTVVALGGGVVGDLAGFAAATYLRGVPWVVVPTSLLAMVDASLGGKTGVNLPQGKNLAGAFHPPRLVLADPATLETLPEAELRSGLAEVVKHGIIADPALFEMCSRGWKVVRAHLDEIVRRSIAVKVAVIQEDPYEQGRRAALNLGHTIGHALEAGSDYRLRHGEAVAIGLVAEARLAESLGLAEKGLAAAVSETLEGLGLPTIRPPDLDRAAILQGIRVDKKRAAGRIRCALPVRIGEVRVGVSVEEADLMGCNSVLG